MMTELWKTPFRYHPLVNKKWMDCDLDYQKRMHEEYEEENPECDLSDPDDCYRELMQNDEIAFIGNSIAFHCGSGVSQVMVLAC